MISEKVWFNMFPDIPSWLSPFRHETGSVGKSVHLSACLQQEERMKPRGLVALVSVLLLLVSVGIQPATAQQIAPEQDLKVAFIGDQGNGPAREAVLKLIQAEGADMVLHQGDLDYTGNPSDWDGAVTQVLGANFPYFASIGNHDVGAWRGTSGYQAKMSARLARVPGVHCSGDLGVQSHCRYRGLSFVLVGPGVMGAGHAAYIRKELATDPAIWKICSWHKNQAAMQVGGKRDEAGWEVYEACRAVGGIIATAHEHSYQRTKTMVSFQEHRADSSCSDPNRVCVAKGKTFAFVSGLGGHSMRDQERCLTVPIKRTDQVEGECHQWASVYTTNQTGGKEVFGALFIIFHYQDKPKVAYGYFKTTDGQVIDQFTVTTTASGQRAPAPPSPATAELEAQAPPPATGGQPNGGAPPQREPLTLRSPWGWGALLAGLGLLIYALLRKRIT